MGMVNCFSEFAPEQTILPAEDSRLPLAMMIPLNCPRCPVQSGLTSIFSIIFTAIKNIPRQAGRTGQADDA